MLFSDLYKIADEKGKPFVRFGLLRDSINALHNGIGRVDLRRVVYPRPAHSAYFHLADSDRTSAYDEEFTVAEIVFCAGLDADHRERRYALTKELMHVFDDDEQRADSRDRFIQLMREVQNQPLSKHASPMFVSEIDTRWMAALALCPRSLRDEYYERIKAGQMVAAEAAEALLIPEWVAASIFDDYYDAAYAVLVEGKNGN